MDRVLFEIVVTIAAACAVGTLAANIVWRAVAAALGSSETSEQAAMRRVRRVGNWNWYEPSDKPAPPPPPPPPPPMSCKCGKECR